MNSDFYNSRWCKTGGWCEQCRESDDSTRRFIHVTFGMDTVNFTCPQGKPWGYRNTSRPIPQPPTDPRILENIRRQHGPCKGCGD